MRSQRLVISGVLALSLSLINTAQAGSVLTGNVRLACEAILCLSTTSAPGACNPALSAYFAIKAKKFSKTLDLRRAFLNVCPSAGEPNMPSLVNAIINGAGQCDDAVLLPRLNRECGEDDGYFGYATCLKDIPANCRAYAAHPLTRIALPKKTVTCTSSSVPWHMRISEDGALHSGEFYDTGGHLCKQQWVPQTLDANGRIVPVANR